MSNTFSLAGKRAIVTAAGQGIGKAAVEAFCAVGSDVLAVDVDEAALAELSGSMTLRMDLTDPGVAEALPLFLPADVLFNCADTVHSLLLEQRLAATGTR